MPQLDLFSTGGPPRPPHNGTPTSKAAAESMAEHLGRLEAIVLDAIREAGDHGATGDEIEVATGLAHQTVGPRLLTLRREGFVRQALDAECHPIRRATRSGRSAGVWIATDHEQATSDGH